MLCTDTNQTRSLTVVLPEAEWRALRDAEPDALGWIQQQIRQRLSSAPVSRPEKSIGPDYSNEDGY